jgi:hypothetical protein
MSRFGGAADEALGRRGDVLAGACGAPTIVETAPSSEDDAGEAGRGASSEGEREEGRAEAGGGCESDKGGEGADGVVENGSRVDAPEGAAPDGVATALAAAAPVVREGVPTARTSKVAITAPAPRAASARACALRLLRGRDTAVVTIGDRGSVATARGAVSRGAGAKGTVVCVGIGNGAVGGNVGSGAITGCSGGGVGLAFGGGRGVPTYAAAACPSVSARAPTVGGKRAWARLASRSAASLLCPSLVNGISRRGGSTAGGGLDIVVNEGLPGSVSCRGGLPGSVSIAERSSFTGSFLEAPLVERARRPGPPPATDDNAPLRRKRRNRCRPPVTAVARFRPARASRDGSGTRRRASHFRNRPNR